MFFDRLARKEAYLDHIEDADPDVLLVSCADKLHNARAILGDFRTVGIDVFGRFNAGRIGALWYYCALADVFVRRLGTPIRLQLMTTVTELET